MPEQEDFTHTKQGGPMRPGESCSSPDKPKTEEKPKTNDKPKKQK